MAVRLANRCALPHLASRGAPTRPRAVFHIAHCSGLSADGSQPFRQGLREGAAANAIERVYGILNGTCNFILTAMEAAHDVTEDEAAAETEV